MDPVDARLLCEGKIDFAFSEFGVTKILGFSPEMTAEIVEQTEVQNIADNTIKPASVSSSPAKSFLMNLVR